LLSLVAPYYSKGEAAQPDYARTGDKRAGLLKLDELGRTEILTAGEFCADVLRL
jgi:predicted nucleic acid-binding protein